MSTTKIHTAAQLRLAARIAESDVGRYIIASTGDCGLLAECDVHTRKAADVVFDLLTDPYGAEKRYDELSTGVLVAVGDQSYAAEHDDEPCFWMLDLAAVVADGADDDCELAERVISLLPLCDESYLRAIADEIDAVTV